MENTSQDFLAEAKGYGESALVDYEMRMAGLHQALVGLSLVDVALALRQVFSQTEVDSLTRSLMNSKIL
jgi:hypothetical protein